ncbi:hypothetical protein [Paludisphaera soli]|uniref:hypothetical protein n=1 Tax=Paludisphaera soli TaxID=2712865 RepID=UPI0013E9CB39|nr:hypothetical protein [Paludisphaera soli]
MPSLRPLSLVVTLVVLSAQVLAADAMPRGYVDDMAQHGDRVDVIGWAMDPSAPAHACEVHFYLDGFPGKGGRFLGAVRADEPRPDLRNGAPPRFGDDRHGYRYSFTMRGEEASQPHSLHVYAVASDGRAVINLSQSPRLINLARAETYWDPGMDQARAATINPVLPFGFWVVGPGGVSGWAFERDAHQSSVDIHVFRNAPDGSRSFVAALRADEPRPDVKAALLDAGVEAGGAVGFHWTPPAEEPGVRWEFLALDSQDAMQAAPLEGPGTEKTLADLVRRSQTPDAALYFEARSPDAAGLRRCWAPGAGGIPPGGGFYTLANDEGSHELDSTGRHKQTCRISPLGTALAARQTYDNTSPHNVSVACPFEFGWGGAGDRTIATLVVDTRHFPSNNTRNNYLGLQLNRPSGIYAGMPAPPDMTRVLGAEVWLRDMAGAGGREEARSVRIPYYFSWISHRTGKTYSISVNLLEYEEGTDVPFIGHAGYYAEPHEGPGTVITLHLSGRNSGLQHPEQDFMQWVPAWDVTCSTPPERMRWRRYTIPIADLVKQLIVDAAITGVTEEAMAPDGRGRPPILSSLIIGGIEQFGRTRVRLDVADHALFLKAPPAR